ncbi:MAG: hypothetical protein JWR05_1388 [Mucilaginibacter sp.]|nr:hypothetical protein [Mucilaginibacter sp.]
MIDLSGYPELVEGCVRKAPAANGSTGSPRHLPIALLLTYVSA